MEEHSFHDRNSLSGNSGSLGAMGQRPKLQPVRIKALLESYGSDDDSEDRERDSEKSEEESDDTDDFQPLPEDSQDPSVNNDFKAENVMPKLESVPEEYQTDVISKDSLSKEKNELDNIQENLFLKENSLLLKKHNDDMEVKKMTTSRIQESKVCSPPPASKNDNNVLNKLALLGIVAENVKRSKSYSPESRSNEFDLLKEKEMKQKETKFRHSEFCPESKERKNSYKSDIAFQEFLSNKNDKIFLNDSKQTESNRSNEQLPVQRTFITENTAVASSFTGTPQLVTETPLKQTQVIGSTRPIPCYSRRDLYMTPQNNVASDYQKSFPPTPATILSNWSHNQMQTPLQDQMCKHKEVIHSSGKPVQSSSLKQELPKFVTCLHCINIVLKYLFNYSKIFYNIYFYFQVLQC